MARGSLTPVQPFQDDAGLLHRHFAGQQGRHFLHSGGVASGFFQAQGRIGWHTPFATTFAVTARAVDGDGAKARVKGARVIGGEAAELLPAHRAHRQGALRLGLRAALHSLPQQVLDILRGLHFKMPKVLIAAGGEALDRIFQTTSRARCQDTQRFG